MLDSTTSVSSSPAVARDSPCASTRNGIPHSSRNTIAGELGGEVHPHARAGCRARARTRRSAGVRKPRPACAAGARLVALGVVLEEEQRPAPGRRTPATALPAKVGRPAEACSSRARTSVATRLPAMPKSAGDLRDERAAPGREPARAEPQHADEGHRVAAAQQRAARRAPSPYDGENAKPELAGGEQHHAQGQHLLGAEPVDQQPDGYLHARVDEQLEDGEGRERGGVDVEAVGGVEAGDAEARAEDDRRRSRR